MFSKSALRQSLVSVGLVFGVALSASAAPVSYQIDTTHSAASFSYRHMGLSTQTGRFDNLTGTVVLDQAAKTGKVDVVVDVASVNTGVAPLDQHLKTADFFDVARFPTANFVSDRIHFEGDRPVSIDGKLTIHGVTREVTLKVEDFVALDAHPMAKKPAMGATAVTTFKRSEFGLGKFTPVNGDEITLRVVLEAMQK